MTTRHATGCWRWLTLASLCFLTLGLTSSCGGSSRAGTDSHTHWLGHCTSDADCDGLSCLCGICSKVCAEADECAELGDGASCKVPLACGSDDSEQTSCQKACESDAECKVFAPDQVCYEGYCEEASTLPDPDPCATMDARTGDSLCGNVAGYTFDGHACRPVICECAGNDCDAMYDTLRDCDDARAACYEQRGIDRACQVNADCVVASRLCCPDPTGLDNVLAVNQTAVDSLRQSLCADDQGCPAIFIPPKPTLYAQCVAGQCETIDIAAIAGCESDEDCGVRSNDCCSCGVQPGAGWLAVASPDGYSSFAGCDVNCDACLDSVPDTVHATCDVDFALCALTSE